MSSYLFHNNVGHVVSIMNSYLRTGTNPNVYCTMCGRFISKQREVARLKCLMNVHKIIGLLDWFMNESNHPGYRSLIKPNDCPRPVLI